MGGPKLNAVGGGGGGVGKIICCEKVKVKFI